MNVKRRHIDWLRLCNEITRNFQTGATLSMGSTNYVVITKRQAEVPIGRVIRIRGANWRIAKVEPHNFGLKVTMRTEYFVELVRALRSVRDVT